MALAADTFYDTKGRPLSTMEAGLGAALVTYHGSLVSVGNAEHGTAANKGYAYPYQDEIGSVPVGFSEKGGTGVSAHTVRDTIQTEGRLRKVAVTGATAQATDAMRWVYATDDGTFTLTRPTLGCPLGVVWEYVSGTTCWVYFFSFGELLLMQASGCAKDTWFLGVLTEGSGTGNSLTGIVAPHHAKIVEVYGIVTEEATDADVDLLINLEIGGTNVTGGVVNWLFNTAKGAKLAGTAVTAANVCHEGDLIDVEVVASVAGTGDAVGKLCLYATVIREPGL